MLIIGLHAVNFYGFSYFFLFPGCAGALIVVVFVQILNFSGEREIA